MTSQPFIVPVAPYGTGVRAPLASPPPQQPSPTGQRRQDVGLLVAGAILVFSAVLLFIIFGVALRGYLGLEAHWAANTSLTSEARELGLRAVRRAGLIRLVSSGPAGFVLAIAGFAALASGARGRLD